MTKTPRTLEPTAEQTHLRRARTTTRAALGIAAACIVVMALFVIDDARDDKETAKAIARLDAVTEQIIEQRTESRINTCENNRKFALAHNTLVYALAEDRSGTRTPEKQAEVDELVAPQIVPMPDCTPQGILDFYEGRNR